MKGLLRRMMTKPAPPSPPVEIPDEDLRIEQAPDRTVAMKFHDRIEAERSLHLRREINEAQAASERRWLAEEARKDERRRKEIERQRVEAVKRGEVYKEPEPPKPRGHIGHSVIGTSMYDIGYASSHPHGFSEVHHHYH